MWGGVVALKMRRRRRRGNLSGILWQTCREGVQEEEKANQVKLLFPPNVKSETLNRGGGGGGVCQI